MGLCFKVFERIMKTGWISLSVSDISGMMVAYGGKVFFGRFMVQGVGHYDIHPFKIFC